ncbi:MAG: hypothetical protein V3U90_05955 [Dehalococcoidia bacterium]
MLKKKRLALMSVAFVVSLIASACAGGEEPTPTPTPVPTPAIILLNPEASKREFFEAIPEEEQQCVEQSIDPTRLEEILEDAETTDEENRITLECLSENTAVGIFLGFFAQTAGDLSNETLDCMREKLAEVDVRSLLLEEEGEEGADEFFLSLFLCLNEEEIARFEAAGGFGEEEEGEPSPAQIACLIELIGEEAAVELASEQRLPTQEELAALAECGITLDGEGGGEEGGPPDLTPEQIACLEEALDPQASNELLSGQRLPTAEEFQAIIDCGIPLGP